MFGHRKLRKCVIKLVLYCINYMVVLRILMFQYFRSNFNHFHRISATQADTSAARVEKLGELPEDGKEPRRKHVGAVINK